MSDFNRRVYAFVARIPEGKIMTYGQIGQLLGMLRGGRQVGWAMARCPEGLPAHRVINQKGEMSPFYVFGGQEVQEGILRAEGVPFNAAGRVRVEACRYRPTD